VSVVGIDGLFLSALSNPMLTTVQLPIREMAEAMVEQVMQSGTAPAAPTRERVFTDLRLIERESVAAPPSSARSGPARPSKKAKP